jgi:hypothetical protein
MSEQQDPRATALVQQGQAELGDRLFKPIVEAAQRACIAKGIPETALVEHAMRNGFAVVEAEGVDQLDREASAGDKAAANLRNEWRDHKFPQSRGARWRRGEGR